MAVYTLRLCTYFGAPVTLHEGYLEISSGCCNSPVPNARSLIINGMSSFTRHVDTIEVRVILVQDMADCSCVMRKSQVPRFFYDLT